MLRMTGPTVSQVWAGLWSVQVRADILGGCDRMSYPKRCGPLA